MSLFFLGFGWQYPFLALESYSCRFLYENATNSCSGLNLGLYCLAVELTACKVIKRSTMARLSHVLSLLLVLNLSYQNIIVHSCRINLFLQSSAGRLNNTMTLFSQIQFCHLLLPKDSDVCIFSLLVPVIIPSGLNVLPFQ